MKRLTILALLASAPAHAESNLLNAFTASFEAGDATACQSLFARDAVFVDLGRDLSDRIGWFCQAVIDDGGRYTVLFQSTADRRTDFEMDYRVGGYLAEICGHLIARDGQIAQLSIGYRPCASDSDASIARTFGKTKGMNNMKPQTAVRAFLTALEEKDMDAFAEVWADDAVQDMPFSPEGFPKRVEGKENVIAHYAAWPDISGDAEFTDHLVFYPMADPDWVFAEYQGRVEILSTGRVYEQQYGGLFHVREGKIVLFREYYDPAAFTYAFDLGPEGASALGANPE